MLKRRGPGPAPERAVERARLGEPEQERDLAHRARRIGEVAQRELAPRAVEDLLVRRPLGGGPALERARVDAHRARDRREARIAAAQLRDDRAADARGVPAIAVG